jgi:hypothetical protein
MKNTEPVAVEPLDFRVEFRIKPVGSGLRWEFQNRDQFRLVRPPTLVDRGTSGVVVDDMLQLSHSGFVTECDSNSMKPSIHITNAEWDVMTVVWERSKDRQ